MTGVNETEPAVTEVALGAQALPLTLDAIEDAIVRASGGEAIDLMTEHDVVVALLARGLGDHDTGTNDSDNGESGAIKQRRRFNIGRDIQTGDVVAVGQTPYPTNARIFVIGA